MTPPKSICILRLSALGDVTHMIPVVHSLQKYWPDTKLTWIIGKNEAKLVNDFTDVNFIIFDKSNTFKSLRHLSNQVKQHSFDILICAQVSLRANIISSLISAKRKLGYDSARAKDLHTLFVNESISPTPQQHVLDSFFSFIEHLGLHQRELTWHYNIPDSAKMFAQEYIDHSRFNIIISPCSSHKLRNWSNKRYAAVADYAIQTFNANILLCGGPSKIELETGQEIEHYMQNPAINLIGKDTLSKFMALLQNADALITPDSGPAHMATGFNTAVIGLYAASNPKRSGPYLSQQWCVDKYNEAAIKFKNTPSSDVKWGTKLEYDGVMDLITVDDVIQKLNQLHEQMNTSN